MKYNENDIINIYNNALDSINNIYKKEVFYRNANLGVSGQILEDIIYYYTVKAFKE